MIAPAPESPAMIPVRYIPDMALGVSAYVIHGPHGPIVACRVDLAPAAKAAVRALLLDAGADPDEIAAVTARPPLSVVKP